MTIARCENILVEVGLGIGERGRPNLIKLRNKAHVIKPLTQILEIFVKTTLLLNQSVFDALMRVEDNDLPLLSDALKSLDDANYLNKIIIHDLLTHPALSKCIAHALVILFKKNLVGPIGVPKNTDDFTTDQYLKYIMLHTLRSHNYVRVIANKEYLLMIGLTLEVFANADLLNQTTLDYVLAYPQIAVNNSGMFFELNMDGRLDEYVIKETFSIPNNGRTIAQPTISNDSIRVSHANDEKVLPSLRLRN